MATLRSDTISGIGTEGPVLNGGLHFRSENYLTLPKGNTTERTATSSGISTVIGAIRYNTDSNKMECYINNKWMIVSTSEAVTTSNRGLPMGGYKRPGDETVNIIQIINIATQSNALDFGDLTQARRKTACIGGRVHAFNAGGFCPATSPATVNTIDTGVFATAGNFVDHGDLTQRADSFAGVSNSVRGVFAGGYNGSSNINNIQFFELSNGGGTQDFGDLTAVKLAPTGAGDATRGIFFGGESPGESGGNNTIDYVTIQSTGNSVDFGDLTNKRLAASAASNPVRAICMGGSTPGDTNIIDFVEIATLGNAKDFGDLTEPRIFLGSVSSSTRAVAFGGDTAPGLTTVMDYVEIMTKNNSIDFGDLLSSAQFQNIEGASNCHGGL